MIDCTLKHLLDEGPFVVYSSVGSWSPSCASTNLQNKAGGVHILLLLGRDHESLRFPFFAHVTGKAFALQLRGNRNGIYPRLIRCIASG